MKRSAIILLSISFLLGIFSCQEPIINPGFEDMEQMTIYDYVVDNAILYSDFLKIMEVGGIAKTLSAYNPDGIGYTLFLPNNNAIQDFINESTEFSSLDELLADNDYIRSFSRYHIVNLGINANDFPFGALPEYTLSGDLLTVSFVVETDTSYYKINNQAPVVSPNIELSNGFIHIISKALKPITYTSYDWLSQNQGFSIFLDAIDMVGLADELDLNTKVEDEERRPFTLLLEPDSVYNNRGIYTVDDLIQLVSPNNANYTSKLNPLYNYVGYHMIFESRFLNDFAERATNYSTYSEIPVHINGLGIDIYINKGKEIFDTIVKNQDTTVIDYVGFYYDESNVITQSGAIHFIDQVLQEQVPSRAIQTFEFYEEPLFGEFRKEPGTYIVDDSSALKVIKYSGSDLFFVESADPEHTAWGQDYIFMDGDFVISYRIPKIVQGKYNAFIRAEAFNAENALIELFIDGKQAGGLIDLTTGGSSDWPFYTIKVGTFDFLRYEEHTIQVRSLIPGRFLWDFVRFEPFIN